MAAAGPAQPVRAFEPRHDDARPQGEPTVDAVLGQLRQQIGPERVEQCLTRHARLAVRDGRLEVTVPTAFLAELVRRQLNGELERAVRTVVQRDGDGWSDPVPLRFRVDRAAFERDGAGSRAAPGGARARGRPDGPRSPHPASRSARPVYRLEEFVVGASNRLAFAAAERVASASCPAGLSPLFIHGGCGLGKTHLLRGIVTRLAERGAPLTVRYTTAEAFTNEFLTALRHNGLGVFRRRVRRVDVLCVDDVHFVATKRATQQELLHTLDTIAQAGARVVLASDEHPSRIAHLSRALSSRFASGMVVRLGPLDGELAAALVSQLAIRRGLRLEPDAVQLLARRVIAGEGASGGEPSVRDVLGLLARVEAVARLDGPAGAAWQGPGAANPLTDNGAPAVGARALDAAFVLRALRLNGGGEAGVLAGRARGPEPIARTVCGVLGVNMSELRSSSRHGRVVLARMMVALLCREQTTLSYPDIARVLGRASHSGVLAAVRRAQEGVARGERVRGPGAWEGRPMGELVEYLRELTGAGR